MSKETVQGLMGEFYLNLGRLTEAEAAFRCVRDLGGLRALEKAYLGDGEFTKALACRQAAGEDWSNAEKVEIGQQLMLRGQLRGAEEAFTSAADVPGLMALGKKLFAANQLGEAMRVFNLARCREDLQAVGRAYLELKQTVDAHRAFSLAQDNDGLRAVVAAYLLDGKLDSAKCLARKIGFVITDEQLIESGWHLYRQMCYSRAAENFVEARFVRGLKSTAEKLLQQGETEAATRIAEQIVTIWNGN